MTRNFRNGLVSLSLCAACGGADGTAGALQPARECALIVRAAEAERAADAVVNERIDPCEGGTVLAGETVELLRVEIDEDAVFARLVFIRRMLHPQSPATLVP